MIRAIRVWDKHFETTKSKQKQGRKQNENETCIELKINSQNKTVLIIQNIFLKLNESKTLSRNIKN